MPEMEKPTIAPALFMAKLSEVARKLLAVLVVFVFLASFHAFFYMVDGGINGLDGGYTMATFIMFGFFQMMLGLLQGFERSLHVRLIVIIVTCNSGNGDTQETENNR
jgi:hypothetical protein